MSVEKSRNTVTHTKLAIRYLEEIQKPRHLQDITPELVQKYKEHLLTKKISKNHINRLVQSIKSAMRIGEKWKYVPKQDWSRVSELKVPRGQVVFHTPEEIDKLLKACPTDTWRLVVLLGADAGLRRGEIMNLRWQDVDANNERIYVDMDEKGYVRTIPTTDCLKGLLAKMRKVAKSEFVINEARDNPNKDYVSIQYVKMSQEVGLPSTIQQLRHTCACQLAKNGLNLYALAKLLGITPVTAQETYGDFIPKVDENAIISGFPVRSWSALLTRQLVMSPV